MTPSVSIVIVAHNDWPNLELAIESALQQSCPDREVIVVDNKSTDDTPGQVSQRYGDRVRYVRQENRRDSGGYNRGIEETSGEFVQLLDGDDFLAPNKIAKQLEVFAANPSADIVYGDARQFQDTAGTPAWSDWTVKQHADMLATLIDPRGEGAGLVIHSPLFRRAVFERVGPWDEAILGADQDYWLRTAWAGCRFVYSPGAWCFHRRRPFQMSADPRAMIARTDQTLQKALGYIDREPYRSALRSRLAALRYGMAVGDLELSRTEALRRLESARELDSSRVTPAAYNLAKAVIAVPGARRLFKSPIIGPIRRSLGRALGVLG